MSHKRITKSRLQRAGYFRLDKWNEAYSAWSPIKGRHSGYGAAVQHAHEAAGKYRISHIHNNEAHHSTPFTVFPED
jgi:hypothetical protein